MGKFNQKKVNSRKTTTYEGGEAYLKNLENEWANLIFSSILQKGSYHTSEEYQDRYIELTAQMTEKYSPSFVAKAATFIRNEIGMRTISELTAALLNSYQFEGKREFYKNYFKRPDGVAEVFAAVESLGGKRSHALIRGCGDYLSSLDAYQLDKYNMRNRQWNMFDLINITHANSVEIDKLKNGTLEKADTWENSINKEGMNQKDRSAEFVRLVESGKMGYLALIRNLNNILKSEEIDQDWVDDYLVTQIIDPIKIKKSMVFPYQIYVAYKASKQVLPTSVICALSDAFKISTGNMKPLKGENAIVIDVSGSMDCNYSQNSMLSIKEISCVYAAALFLKQNGNFDIFKFGSEAKQIKYSKLVDAFELIDQMQNNEHLGYSTEIDKVFNIMDKKYDRIFLFSDMQVMNFDNFYGYSSATKNLNAYNMYKRKFGYPMIYSFDLGNCGNQIESNDNKIKYITTVSDKLFDIIEYLEDSDGALIDYIEEYRG